MTPSLIASAERTRNLTFFREPGLWPAWPFLPLVRRRPGADEELGLLFDAVGALGRYGFSACVFLSNVFEVPSTFDGLLELPRECFDAPEEIYAALWRVD